MNKKSIYVPYIKIDGKDYYIASIKPLDCYSILTVTDYFNNAMIMMSLSEYKELLRKLTVLEEVDKNKIIVLNNRSKIEGEYRTEDVGKLLAYMKYELDVPVLYTVGKGDVKKWS